jgi:hypothetical protein
MTNIKKKKKLNDNKTLFESVGRLPLYEAILSKQEKIIEIRSKR